MRELLSVELRRMLARRLVRVLAALALVGIAIAGVIVAAASNPDLGPELALAQRQVEEQRALCEEAVSANPQDFPLDVDSEEFCRESIRMEFFYRDPRFHLTVLRDVFLGTAIFLVVGGWLLGASFMGAEWHAGTVATLLTWEPRRLWVFVAKLAAAAAVLFLLALVLQAVLGLVLALVAALRGTTEGADVGWLRSVSGVALRAAAITAMAGAMGFAIATIARNTAAALGVGFAYLAVVEGLVRGLRPQWHRWLIGDNAALFLTGQDGFPPVGRSPLGAAAVIAVYAAVLLLVAVVAFRDRDVT
ncbi:MAG: ABC transporter permease subunit [Actinomycetota bacterium]